jgi:hypothetical protein
MNTIDNIMELAEQYASQWENSYEWDKANTALRTALTELTSTATEYQQAADKMAMEHKVERDALTQRVAELEKERLRLCGEVSNRNMRALEGDKAQAAFDRLYAEHEALLTQIEASWKQVPMAWELFFDNGNSNGFTSDKGEAAEFGENKRPLYAAPVVAPDVLKDAERYRFLRTSNRISGSGIGASVKSGWLWNLDFENLDAVIDAAIGDVE